jgi:hypothetical protein
MLEDRDVSKNPESRQITLMDLFLAMAFCMPIVAATTELKHSGGGTMRYVVAVPSALALGVVIVWLDWNLGKTVWFKGQRYSKQAQNAVAMTLFALELLWIVVGGILGSKLAAFVTGHVPR